MLLLLSLNTKLHAKPKLYHPAFLALTSYKYSKMAQVNGNAPKITLYTNHRCPWAHRAHIVLKELGLKYEEVIIDLDRPREKWYLDINPVSQDDSRS
jgi:glutathionyl-hydroquinone reductase